MKEQSEYRRYLINVDSDSMSQRFADCLVIGAGIAGLRATLEAAAKDCKVVLACKGKLEESNTFKAQGGIASVLEKADSFESHISDTLNTGCGLCDDDVVRQVINSGPELLGQLYDWGVQFDLDKDKIATTLEGGHSHSRVAHAHGDETGKMIAEVLVAKARSHKNIQISENFFAIDLLTDENKRCLGVVGLDSRGSGIIWAANTILTTGGIGQLYRETTNPAVATGDGLAMAYRAGAVLQDMEFVQFHPTTLYIAGASRALITETLRGEGAILVDNQGRQFMKEYDQAAELAPRDVVSRAILAQMLKTNSTHVYLDVRHMDKAHLSQRFPVISELCEGFDIDLSKDLIPVRPSAHYMIGGVKTDNQARTNIEHLYACGEVAATGLHGANRLGSNSLLEGLVFGKIAGANVAKSNNGGPRSMRQHIRFDIPQSDRTRLDADDVRNSLRALMWRNVGITRTETQLTEAQEIISFWQRYVMDKIFEEPQGLECQNMLSISLLMARAAQKRKESRGVHFRRDYAQRDDENFKTHFELKGR